LSLFVIIYIALWIKANFKKTRLLRINNSILKIKMGDLFNEKELKVIAFNEYFDTKVDNKIISENTLNGKFLKTNKIKIKLLEKEISKIDKSKIIKVSKNRVSGKKNKHSLGTTILCDDYLITAFSKFDENNRAYLWMQDILSFYQTFWNEIDILYSGRSVAIPLLGSGITRFKGYDLINEQELLELLIWTFKISRMKFTHPSELTIVIHKSKFDKINLYNLIGD